MPKQLLKSFQFFLFAIFLIGSLFGLLGIDGIGGVEVRAADKIEYITISNSSSIIPFIPKTEYRGGIAVIVNGNFRGLVGCQNTGVLAKDDNNSALNNNAACAGTVITQNGRIINTGSVIDKNAKMEFIYKTDEPNDFKAFAIPDYKIYRNAGSFGTSGDADIIIFNTKSGTYVSGKEREFFADPIRPKKEEIEAVIKTRSDVLNLTGASVLGTQVTSGTVGILDTAKAKEAEISAKANATCKAILDKDNKVIYECIDKDGKKVGLDGKPLAEGNGGFTVDATGNQVDLINQSVVDESKKLASNTEATTSNQTTDNKDAGELTGDVALKGIGALFNIILTVISFIILALTYFAGWLAVGALWILGYLFLIFLRINPAGANFISVAVDPWRIVVGIANMMVLSTFIFVGFGYILDIAKLKVKIDDFLLKIVMFTLILNFTLLGSASIVNVTQGIGEVMVGAYSIGETDPQKANFALINGLIEGMSRASVLRCGNLEWATDGNDKPATPQPTPALAPGEKAPPSASEGATGKDCEWGGFGVGGQVGKLAQTYAGGLTGLIGINNLRVNGKAGSIVSITIMELVFLAIAVFAVVQFWKALALVLGRTIGLWLLIVLSPLALAAYISPIEGLKKYASQWLDHFWKWCLFYPAFIFCLILINIMSRSFSDAASAQVNNLASNPNGIVTNANEFTIGGVDAVNLMLFAILGVVPMFLLSATVDYFAKSFEAIAKMTLGAAKQAWTGFKGAATTMGGIVSGGATKLGNSIDSGKLKKVGDWGRQLAADKSSRIQDKIDTQDGIISGTSGSYTSAQVIEAQKEKEKLIKYKAKADADAKGRFSFGLDTVAKSGKVIAMAPLAAEYAVKQAKYHGWDKWATGNQAQQAGSQEEIESWAELRAREKATTQEQIDAIDRDPTKRRWIGEGQVTMAQRRKEHTEAGNTGDPYKNEQKGYVSQKVQEKLGTSKAKRNQNSTIALAKHLMENLPEDVDTWSETDLQLAEAVTDEAVDNKSVGNMFLTERRGQQIVQKIYGRLSPETQKKLSENYGSSLPSVEQRKNFGADIAKNWANIKDTELVGLDEDTIQGIIENKGTIPIEEIYARTGKGATTAITNSEAKRVIGRDARFVTENDQNKVTLNNLGELSREQGFNNERNVQREISLGVNEDSAFKLGYKNEYGTDKYDNIEAGLVEIKALDLDALLATDKGKYFAQEDSEIARLLAGSATEIDEATELIRRGVAESFYSHGLRLPAHKNFVQESGKAVMKGKVAGQKLAQTNALAHSALKKAAGNAGGDRNQVERELNKELMQIYLGAADLGKKYSSQVVSGDKIEIAGIASDFFTKIRDSKERNEVAAELTEALGTYADTGNDVPLQALSARINSDYGVQDSGAAAGNAIDIATLKTTIKQAGKDSVAGIKASGEDLLASVKAAITSYDSAAQSNYSGAMEKAKIFDPNLASNLAGVYKTSARFAGTGTGLEAPRMAPRVDANSIVPFERDVRETVTDSSGASIVINGKVRGYKVIPVTPGVDPIFFNDEASLVAAGYDVPR